MSDGSTKDDATANVPAVVPSPWSSADRNEVVDPGTYWRHDPREGGPSLRGLDPGTVLLVKDVEDVDGVQHTVVIAGHPMLDHRSTYRMLVGNFLAAFVPAEEGDREREIADLQARIAALSARIADGAPPALPRMSLPAPTGADDDGAASRAVVEATAGWLEAQEAHAKDVRERADEIKSLTGALGNFFSEKAQVALSRVGGAIAHAEDVKRRVATFDAYRTENVQIAHHLEGESADPSEPLVLYQRILHLDEETAAHHAAAGGVDFRVFEERGAVRALYDEDPTLIERLVPAPRGVALVRLRRHGKEYVDPSKPGGAVTNAVLNEANKERWLVVRDGENVRHVHAEDLLYVQGSLFPTAREMDRIFEDRWGGGRIGQDDVDLPRAKRRHDAVALAYRRVLYLLQGLHDHHGAFGAFAGLDRHGPPSNWSRDDAFMTERVRFVHDAEAALASPLPSFRDWAGEANRYVPKGATVVVDTKWLREERDGYFLGPRGEESHHRPASRHIVATVGGTKGRLFVPVPTSYEAFVSDRTVTRTPKIWLDTLGDDPAAVARGDTSSIKRGIVRIDHLDVEDVRRRINSRELRKDYLESMPVYAAAVAHLTANPVPEGRGEAATLVASAAGAAADRAAKALADREDVVERAKRVARERGDEPLAVALDEAGRTVVHVRDPDAPRFADVRATVRAYRVERPGPGERTVMPAPNPSVLWDAGAVPERSFSPSVGYRRYGHGNGGIAPFRAVLDALSEGWTPPSADDLVRRMDEAQKRSSGVVDTFDLVRVLGIVRVTTRFEWHDDRRGRRPDPERRIKTRSFVPCLTEGAIEYAARVHGAATADRMVRWYMHRKQRYDPALHGTGGVEPNRFGIFDLRDVEPLREGAWRCLPYDVGARGGHRVVDGDRHGWRWSLARAVAETAPSGVATFTLADCLDGFDPGWVDLLDEALSTPPEDVWALDKPLRRTDADGVRFGVADDD